MSSPPRHRHAASAPKNRWPLIGLVASIVAVLVVTLVVAITRQAPGDDKTGCRHLSRSECHADDRLGLPVTLRERHALTEPDAPGIPARDLHGGND